MRPRVVVLPSWVFKAFGGELLGMGLQVILGPQMPPNRTIVYCDEGTLIIQLYRDAEDGQPRVSSIVPVPTGPIQFLMPPPEEP
jgi:hypothetical protein